MSQGGLSIWHWVVIAVTVLAIVALIVRAIKGGSAPPAAAGAMRFKNPANGYEETVSRPFLWALLFGPIYFAVKGVWLHAVIALVLAFTIFVSWLIYPFFARTVIRTHYLRQGWQEVA